MLSGGITFGRDEEQDKKIEGLEQRMLVLEDVAGIGKGQEIADERISLLEAEVIVVKKEATVLKKKSAKKLKHKFIDWYKGQL